MNITYGRLCELIEAAKTEFSVREADQVYIDVYECIRIERQEETQNLLIDINKNEILEVPK